MENSLNQFSDEELNLVTDYLLQSAKKRFNYRELRKELSHFDEEFIDYNILLEIISGKTLNESNQVISARILSKFLISGYMVENEEIEKMVNQKEKELGMEILCSKIAMDSLQNGAHPTTVIQQISQLL